MLFRSGHGGCCGSYKTTHINMEGTGLGTNMLNDPNVLKSSVLDTNGMVMTKYRWIRRPAPYISVKPDNTLNNNSAAEYTDNLKRTTLSNQCSITKNVPVTNSNCCPNMKRHYTDFDAMTRENVVVKPPTGGKSYDEYIQHLIQDCAENDVKYPTRTTQHTPFACSNP